MSFHPKDDNIWQRLLKSSWFASIINVPVISWVVTKTTRIVIRNQQEVTQESIEEDDISNTKLDTNLPTPYSDYTSKAGTESRVPHTRQRGEREDLERIVKSVVDDFEYVAAFLALYEEGDVLPIHAFYIREDIISPLRLMEYEFRVSQMMNQKMSLSDPDIARVDLNDKSHAENLSIRAVKKGEPVIDSDLFSLFTPIVQDLTRPIFAGIQEEYKIKEVVAVPFTTDYDTLPIDDTQPERPNDIEPISSTREIVGNLFAISRNSITKRDIKILKAFGNQAAAAIQNSNYKKQSKITQSLISRLQHNLQNEKQTLQEFVKFIVNQRNYAGALIAISDTQNILRVKAYHLAPELYQDKPIKQWQQTVSDVAGASVNLQKLDIIDVDLNEQGNSENIAFKVMSTQQTMTSKSIYSLFRPMIPNVARNIVETIQAEMGIKNVLAIPLLSYRSTQQTFKDTDSIGVLYVVSRSNGFRPHEVELLKSLAQQVRNMMVYTLSEKRRQASERFARMAFNANASIHAITNDITIIKMKFDLVRLNSDNLDAIEKSPELEDLIERGPQIVNEINNLLDKLGDPFIDASEETEISISSPITSALHKVDIPNSIDFTHERLGNVPPIIIFPEMIKQLLRIFIMRAVNAIGKCEDGKIHITTSHLDEKNMIHINIFDNGQAIDPDELSEIFDIHEDTTDPLIGFGLFWANDYITGIGGTISVKSISKQGTTFVINIPVRKKTSVPNTVIMENKQI